MGISGAALARLGLERRWVVFRAAMSVGYSQGESTVAGVAATAGADETRAVAGGAGADATAGR